MISCRVAALTVLLSTASTLTLARTEELPKEEARSEEVDVEASEEAVSIESTASAEALAFVQATTMPEDDEWHFIVAPYLWLVDTSITMRIGPIVQEVDVPFDAVLSQLKGAFVIHFEANKKRWGAVTDFQYVSAVTLIRRAVPCRYLGPMGHSPAVISASNCCSGKRGLITGSARGETSST